MYIFQKWKTTLTKKISNFDRIYASILINEVHCTLHCTYSYVWEVGMLGACKPV